MPAASLVELEAADSEKLEKHLSLDAALD